MMHKADNAMIQRYQMTFLSCTDRWPIVTIDVNKRIISFFHLSFTVSILYTMICYIKQKK